MLSTDLASEQESNPTVPIGISGTASPPPLDGRMVLRGHGGRGTCHQLRRSSSSANKSHYIISPELTRYIVDSVRLDEAAGVVFRTTENGVRIRSLGLREPRMEEFHWPICHSLHRYSHLRCFAIGMRAFPAAAEEEQADDPPQSSCPPSSPASGRAPSRPVSRVDRLPLSHRKYLAIGLCLSRRLHGPLCGATTRPWDLSSLAYFRLVLLCIR